MGPSTGHFALRPGVALLAVFVVACDGRAPTEVAATSKTTAPIDNTSTVTPAPTGLLFPRRQEYAHNLKITKKYDRIDNYTSVDLDEMSLGGGLKLKAYFVYTGKEFIPPQAVTLHFSESSDTWKYLTYHPIRLLLNDSEPVDLGEVDHNGTVGSGYVLEQMIVRLPVRQLLEIVAAKKVEGRLGLPEFMLKQSQLEALRDLASRMAPTQ